MISGATFRYQTFSINPFKATILHSSVASTDYIYKKQYGIWLDLYMVWC